MLHVVETIASVGTVRLNYDIISKIAGAVRKNYVIISIPNGGNVHLKFCFWIFYTTHTVSQALTARLI